MLQKWRALRGVAVENNAGLPWCRLSCAAARWWFCAGQQFFPQNNFKHVKMKGLRASEPKRPGNWECAGGSPFLISNLGRELFWKQLKVVAKFGDRNWKKRLEGCEWKMSSHRNRTHRAAKNWARKVLLVSRYRCSAWLDYKYQMSGLLWPQGIKQ